MHGDGSTIRAAIYTRVSTDDQAERGYSLDEQERLARAYCEEQGWTVARVYRDEGVSGRTARRPEYQRLLADAESGEFSRVVVWKRDRFGRDMDESIVAQAMLRRFEVEVVSVTEPNDRSPEGLLSQRVLDAIGEFEAARTGQRVRPALAARRRQGRKPGGPANYGFDYVRDHSDPSDKGMLVGNEREAAIVLDVYVMYRAQPSVSHVVRTLRERGLRTRNGAEWSHYQVAAILDNPVYAGWIYDEDGETLIEGAHEGIVPRQLWLEVHELRQARRSSPGKGRGRNPVRPHLLTLALGRCGRCGSPLMPRGDRYVCRRRHQYGDCDFPSIPRPRLDLPLLEEFERRILDLDATRELIEESARNVRDDARRERERAEHDLARAEAALERIDRAFREGDLPTARYERQASKAEADLAGASAELERLSANAERVAELIAAVEAIDGHTEALKRLQELRDVVAGRLTSQQPIEALRETLRTIFQEIVVHVDDVWDDLWLVPVVRDEALLGYEVKPGSYFDDGSPFRHPLYQRRPLPIPFSNEGNARDPCGQRIADRPTREQRLRDKCEPRGPQPARPRQIYFGFSTSRIPSSAS